MARGSARRVSLVQLSALHLRLAYREFEERASAKRPARGTKSDLVELDGAITHDAPGTSQRSWQHRCVLGWKKLPGEVPHASETCLEPEPTWQGIPS